MIDSRILELEQFGVGNFSDAEIAQKTSYIRKLMEKRLSVVKPYLSVVVPAYREQWRTGG